MLLKTLLVYSILFGCAHSFAQGNLNAAPTSVTEVENLGAVPMWIIKRLHTISIDTQSQEMIQNGVKSRKFIAGFTAEGALVFQHEIDKEKLENWDNIGRDSGMQIVSYKIQALENGQKKISASVITWKNMNAMNNAKKTQYDETSAFEFIDRIDLVSATWDDRMTFNGIKTFDLNVFKIDAKYGLVSDKNGGYLAIRGSLASGMRWMDIDNLPEGIRIRNSNSPKFSSDLSAGVELNLQHQNRKRPRINLQSNFAIGQNQMAIYDDKAKAQFQENAAQEWAAYLKGSNYIWANTNYNYAESWQEKNGYLPADPKAYDKVFTRGTHLYGYLKNSVDISIPLNRTGRPKRLGLELQYNIPVFDKIVGKRAGGVNNKEGKTSTDEGSYMGDRKGKYKSAARSMNIDLTDRFNQVFVGKLYFKF